MADSIRRAIDLSAVGIEALAVLIILVAVVYGTVRYVLRSREGTREPYEEYRVSLGRAMLLGLEFLVAADIVRTVALAPTLANVVELGLLVIVRTFLSWSLSVEIEGRWPWRGSAATAAAEPAITRR